MRCIKLESEVIQILLLISFPSIYGESRKHTFIANTNFDNPLNWDNAHGLPCVGDRILFQPDEVISVFVQTGTAISELVLPLNGEFIFGDGFVWGVSNDLSPCSHGGTPHDLYFDSDPDSWFSPANWRPSSVNDDAVIESQDVLDVEKVPCDSDDIIFPDSTSYTTEIELDASSRSLRMADKTYNTQSFAQYRKYEGQYKFTGRGDVTIKAEGCQDPTGCLCRNSDDAEAAYDTICGYIDCGNTQCENPIMGYGSCCKRCGGMIVFNYTDKYTESHMRDFLSSISSKPEYADTHTVLSKVDSRMALSLEDRAVEQHSTYDGPISGVAIQIYVTDDDRTGEIAKRLTNQYYNVLSSPTNDFGVSVITIQSSGSEISQGLGVAAIAGIVIGSIFAVILTAIVAYGCRSVPLLRGKKYGMEFALDDGISNNFTDITEVGPGEEFESSDYDSRIKAKQTVSLETVGWPQRSVMDSDFGVSFGNPAFESDDL